MFARENSVSCVSNCLRAALPSVLDGPSAVVVSGWLLAREAQGRASSIVDSVLYTRVYVYREELWPVTC